jgi:hypothetical protein
MASHPTTKLSDRRPETPGRLQESLTTYPSRPTAQRDGGSLQRPGWASSFSPLFGDAGNGCGASDEPVERHGYGKNGPGTTDFLFVD